MPRLPDVLQIGPFSAPTWPLAVLVGFFAWYSLSVRWAPRWGVDHGFVEDLLNRVLIGGLVGAKLVEVVRSPASFLASPRLLVSMPVGPLPLLGAVLGAAAWVFPLARRHWRTIPTALDALAAPFAAGLGVASLGVGDERSVLLAVGFLLTGGAVAALRGRAEFPGHLALGTCVLGSLVVVAADFVRPAPTLVGGVSVLQLAAGAVGLAAYGLALWMSRQICKAGEAGDSR